MVERSESICAKPANCASPVAGQEKGQLQPAETFILMETPGASWLRGDGSAWWFTRKRNGALAGKGVSRNVRLTPISGQQWKDPV